MDKDTKTFKGSNDAHLYIALKHVLVSAVRLFLSLIVRHKSVKFHLDRTPTGDKSINISIHIFSC